MSTSKNVDATLRITAGIFMLTAAIGLPTAFTYFVWQGQMGPVGVIAVIAAILEGIAGALLIRILSSSGKVWAYTSAISRIVFAAIVLGAIFSLLNQKDGMIFGNILSYGLFVLTLHFIIVGIAMWRSPELPTPIGVILIIVGAFCILYPLLVWLRINLIDAHLLLIGAEGILIAWLFVSGFRLRINRMK